MFYFISGFLLGSIFFYKYRKKHRYLDDLILLVAYNIIPNIDTYMFEKKDCMHVNVAIKLNCNEIVSALEKRAEFLKLTPLTAAQKYFILKYIINNLKFSYSQLYYFTEISCDESLSRSLILDFPFLYKQTLNILPIIKYEDIL